MKKQETKVDMNGLPTVEVCTLLPTTNPPHFFLSQLMNNSGCCNLSWEKNVLGQHPLNSVFIMSEKSSLITKFGGEKWGTHIPPNVGQLLGFFSVNVLERSGIMNSSDVSIYSRNGTFVSTRQCNETQYFPTCKGNKTRIQILLGSLTSWYGLGSPVGFGPLTVVFLGSARRGHCGVQVFFQPLVRKGRRKMFWKQNQKQNLQ